MAETATISKVKTDLRISHSSLDSDLSDVIDSCLQDLEITAGVSEPDETDPLILSAIKLYVRATYTDDTNKAAAYTQRYDAIKASISMASGYGGADDDD